MTRLCCPRCKLRFAPAATAYLSSCPECGLPPAPVDDPESLVGLRLFDPSDLPDVLPEAVAVSLPEPEPPGARS
jgi:hypothetical protein